MTYKDPNLIIDKLTDDSIYFGDSPLWTAATSGDLDYIHNHYKNGGKPNQRFNGFGSNHSLIMGAVRNGKWDVVDALKGYGETILPEEQEEYDLESKKGHNPRYILIGNLIGKLGNTYPKMPKENIEQAANEIVTSWFGDRNNIQWDDTKEDELYLKARDSLGKKGI